MVLKWREKYLHIVCLAVLTVPVFSYLLNGGLYVRNKVLIPFLPLLVFMTAEYLEKQKQKELSFLQSVIPFILTILFVFLQREALKELDCFELLLLDSTVMLLCVCLFFLLRKFAKNKVLLLLAPPVLFLSLFGFFANSREGKMLDTKLYETVTEKGAEEAVGEILSKEGGWFRVEQGGTYSERAANINRTHHMGQYLSSIYSSTYNEAYQEFRTKTFSTEQPFRNILMQAGAENAVLQRLMGVKYILSEKDVPGYEKYKETEGVGIYRNKDVLPVAYVTDEVMSEKEYRTLSFPYNQTAFLNGAVAEGANGKKTSLPKVQTIDMNDGKKAEEDGILFLRFRVENNRPNEDAAALLQGVRNKLTARNHIYYNENEIFTYAVNVKKGEELPKPSAVSGDFAMKDMTAYWLPLSFVKSKEKLCKSEFLVDKEKTKGNRVSGTFHAEEGDYLITSIPYDEHFEVRIDGKRQTYEKVNTAFIGFRTPAGEHTAELIYHAPGVGVGKLLSLIGIFMWIGTAIIRRCAFLFWEIML